MLTPADLDALEQLRLRVKAMQSTAKDECDLAERARIAATQSFKAKLVQKSADLIRLARIGMAAEQRDRVPQYDPMLHSQEAKERGA